MAQYNQVSQQSFGGYPSGPSSSYSAPSRPSSSYGAPFWAQRTDGGAALAAPNTNKTPLTSHGSMMRWERAKQHRNHRAHHFFLYKAFVGYVKKIHLSPYVGCFYPLTCPRLSSTLKREKGLFASRESMGKVNVRDDDDHHHRGAISPFRKLCRYAVWITARTGSLVCWWVRKLENRFRRKTGDPGFFTLQIVGKVAKVSPPDTKRTHTRAGVKTCLY